MSSFVIPKGIDFDYKMNIIQNGSFIAQDLSEMESATFEVFGLEDGICMLTSPMTVPTDTIISPAVDPVIQIDDITIAVVANETEYGVTVDGTYYSYTSDIDATTTEIVDGLVSAMAVAIVTVSNVADMLHLEGPADFSSYVLSVTNNMYITETQEANEGSELVETDNALNGRLEGTIDSTLTETLVVLRGPKEDGYYIKPNYQGRVTITFTELSEILDINVHVSEISISPTGTGTCPTNPA